MVGVSMWLDDVVSRPVSHWIVADLNTVEGRALLSAAIKQLVQLLTYLIYTNNNLTYTVINGDGGYGLQAAYIGGPAAQVSWLGPKAPFLYSLREPSEVLQWLCYDDSTINIVVVIIYYYYYSGGSGSFLVVL